MLLLGVAIACGGPAGTPESRIREMVARAEHAAEARDVGALKEMVSETYADDRGNDKRGIRGLLALHLLRNRSVHLLVRIRDLAVSEPDTAKVTLLVAMAGRPIADVDALASIRADLYRFDLGLVREGEEWRVRRAAWRPLTPDDFL